MLFGIILFPALLIPNLSYSSKNEANNGEKTFQLLCVGCHGPDGRAQTDMGKKLQAADLTSAVVQDQKNSQLLNVIKNGRGKMPAWSDKLSDSEIHAVLDYVRQFRTKSKD